MQLPTSTSDIAAPAAQALPRFSLVMPSHNRRNQLERALQHLARQTYPAELLELVVVLDGCTDGSAQMLERLQPGFPFPLTVIQQPQSGPSAARNTGVRAARYEYVLMLDDDVMATPALVLEHWHTHRDHPRTVVVGPMSKPADNKGPIWVRWEEYILERQYHDLAQGRYDFTPRQFYTGNCSLQREWIMQAGLFDESFKRYEDVELGYRLVRLGLNFRLNMAAVGYHYPQRSFASWAKMHRLYGQYAVKIDRDKNMLPMIKISYDEFKQRHWLTRFASTRLLGRLKMQQALTIVFVRAAQLSGWLKLDWVGYKLLSCVANVLYWQGFNEELKQAQSLPGI